MTVICDACGTENRVNAMFCRGCANKLPAFAPTGISALETLGLRSSKNKTRVSIEEPFPAPGTFVEPASVRRWIAVLVFFTVAVLGVVAWFAFGHQGANESASEKVSQTAPLPSADSVAAAPTPALAPATAPDSSAAFPVSPDAPLPGSRLPPESSLAPNETLEQSSGVEASAGKADSAAAASTSDGPQAPAASVSAAAAATAAAAPSTRKPSDSALTALSPTTNQRSAAQPGRRATANPSSGGRAADPRVGCDHLFFAFAARCEANHCQQAAYARHPRCEVVREQRRLDDARRNSLPSN